ncbi:MAG: DNA polymerase III subunit gamma/tau, partial [Lysobacter sp.]|nr:DNA polymerase III subunit gamma/tau [Lysobacter sp.]
APPRPSAPPPQPPVMAQVRDIAPAYAAPAPQTYAHSGSAGIADADAWHDLVAGSGLRGPARLLAEHSGFIGYADGVLRLSLPADDEHLRAPALIQMVADALAPRLGGAPQIRFEAAQSGESLRERNERARDQRQASAEDAFMNDPDVQRLISQHGARVVPDSIRPFDEA